MKLFVPVRSMVGSLLLLAFGAVVCAQTPCTILVQSLDTGTYDSFGEHSAELTEGLTGIFGQETERDPYRSFMVFRIPQFPGTLESATIEGAAYTFSPSGPAILQLVHATNSADVVRRPHFFATHIYSDLGTGIVYGSATFTQGYWFASVALNNNGRAAIAAARGQDFVLGGTQPTADGSPEYNLIRFPQSFSPPLTLRLEISAPNEPSIYEQPTSTLLFSNDAVVSVGACGAEPLTYTWFVDGTNYQSWNNSSQIYLGSSFVTNTAFVVISNSFGSATSTVATVRRLPARMTWTEGTNIAVRSGTFVHAPIQVFSPGFFSSYTWLKDGLPFQNPQFNAIQFFNAQPTNSGDYTLVVSNALGVATSAVMRLDVLDIAPRFWEQPRSTTNALGNYATFSVTVSAGPLPTLRWYRNGLEIPPSTNLHGSFFILNNLQLSDAGDYFVVASNRAGLATSAVARLEVILDPPVFTAQPQDIVSYPGRFVNFAVSTSGSPFPSFQWYFNNTPIPGARSASLVFSGVSITNAGGYFCIASNASGMATSEVATLSVLAVPPVIDGPQDATAAAGHFGSIVATISNPPACVRWFVDGSPASEACAPPTTSPYQIPLGVVFGNSNYTAQFFLIASNEHGLATSRVASVTVTTAPPRFINQPSDQTVLEGSTVFIPAQVTGAPIPQALLYRSGQPVDAFFNGIFYLFNVASAQSGEYTIVASNSVGMATSAPFRLTVQRLGPLDRWTRRHPTPQGNDLHALTFAQDRYVACGDVGTIVTSTNATNWSVFSASMPAELEGVAYGNGRFVCVGSYGFTAVTVTSTNGETWVTHELNLISRLRGITFDGANFIAIGYQLDGQRVYVSSNGVDWVANELPFSNPRAFDVVAYGNGRVVIGEDNGRMDTTSDLVNWTNALVGVSDPEGIAFVDNRFIVSGNNGRLAISTDGYTWVSLTNGATERRLFNVAYNAGLYVAVGARGTIISANTAANSSWVLEASPTPDRLEDVVYANDLFVAVGENGTIVTSPDGHQWTEQTRGVTEDLDDIAVSDDLAIAVGKAGTILTSTDGQTWVLAPLPVPFANSPPDWHGVAFGDGKIVAVGQTTNVLVSNDEGVSWQAHSFVASSNHLKSVIYAQGLWIAVGVGGVIMTSLDATNWTHQISPSGDNDLNDIAYGHGQFVIVGDQWPNPNATILTSDDGTNWINRTYPLGKNARAITFQQGHFVVAGNDGRFLVTTNPTAWGPSSLSYYSSDGDNHRDVTAHERIWISVGNDGIIVTAPSTSTGGVGGWKPRQSRTVENLHGVRYFKGHFLAVGNRGLILQSGSLEPRLAIERDGANIRLVFSSPHEGVFRLQDSTDLTWQNAGTITNALGTVEKLVPASDAARFYRVQP